MADASRLRRIRSLSIAFILGCLTTLITLSSVRGPGPAADARAPEQNPPIVATVGSRSISLQELEQSAAIALYQTDQQRDTILRKTLQQMIDEELLHSHAAQKGITVEQLLGSASESPEIARLANLPGPVKRPTSGPSGQGQAWRSQDLHEEARIRQALLVSLRRQSKIQIELPGPQPPVLPVSPDDDPSLGSPDAPITIVEFSDFQCPYCKLSVPVLKEIVTRYAGQVRVVYRDYPGPNHPHARQAAEAAQCAGDQMKFWDYHDLLFQRQVADAGWDFVALANELQLDSTAFTSCLKTGRYRDEVLKDLRDAIQLGVSSSPTFFINGRPLIGVHPLADFAVLIDPLLRR